MEWKIGEIRQINGEWYQCAKSDGTCNGCVGKFQSYSLCNEFDECVGKIFKKLEKVGEPYELDGYLFQSYHTFEVPIFTENYATVREYGNNSKISIEIKQTKEVMEEKKIQHYDCFFDREPSKSGLKPFSLEAAKAGKPVCTRDGRKARIICFDAKRKDKKSIIALVPSKDYPGFDDLIAYPNNGNYYGGHENDGDLMMLPEKRSGWINVKKDASLFKSREEAERNCTKDYAPVRVEFEI